MVQQISVGQSEDTWEDEGVPSDKCGKIPVLFFYVYITFRGKQFPGIKIGQPDFGGKKLPKNFPPCKPNQIPRGLDIYLSIKE